MSVKTYDFPAEFIFPWEPGFEETMLLGWDKLKALRSSSTCIVGVDGIPRSASESQVTEYLEGGEYEERQNLIQLPYVVDTSPF